MKTYTGGWMRAVVFGLVALAAGGDLFGQQTVQYFTVVREKVETQTDVNTFGTAMYRFAASIDLQGSGSPPALGLVRVTHADGTTVIGSLAYEGGNSRWHYGSTDTSDQTGFITAFPDANYKIQYSIATDYDQTATITLPTPDPYLNSAKLSAYTVSAATWSGGALYYDTTQALTLDFNQVFTAGTPANQGYHWDLSIWGGPTSVPSSQAFANYDPTASGAPLVNSPTFTIGAGTLAAGTYTVEINYNSIQYMGTDTYTGATTLGLAGSVTSFTLIAVPEPATAAAFAGLLGFGLILWRRRRVLG